MLDLITSTTSYQWVIPLTWDIIVLTLSACVVLLLFVLPLIAYQEWKK